MGTRNSKTHKATSKKGAARPAHKLYPSPHVGPAQTIGAAIDDFLLDRAASELRTRKFTEEDEGLSPDLLD